MGCQSYYRVIGTKLVPWLTFIFLLMWGAEVSAEEFGLVRIRVAEDSVQLLVDSSAVALDAYGNPLTGGAWFIVNLPVGNHNLEFLLTGFDPIKRTASVLAEKVVTLEVRFVPIDTTALSGQVVLMLTSDPDSAEIYLDGKKLPMLTPSIVPLDTGSHRIELYRDSFEPLAKSITIGTDESRAVKFILRSLPPEAATLESMGLERSMVSPLMPIDAADKTWNMYRGLAEAFAIVPFSQGVLAKILGSSSTDKEANLLIAIGAGLTGGAYILGKVLSSKKRKHILETNETIKEANRKAQVENKDLENMVRSQNRSDIEKWEKENRTRGRVEFSAE